MPPTDAPDADPGPDARPLAIVDLDGVAAASAAGFPTFLAEWEHLRGT